MENYINFFSKVFLFSSLPSDSLARAVSECEPEIRSYHRGEVIFTPENYEKEIGFIFSGECEILRAKNDGIDVSLNILKTGNSFGILAVLSQNDEFPTKIVARLNTEVLFIKKSKLLRLIRHYPTVAMNVISFLTERINFLNRKIATFSSDSVVEKLARYILSNARENGATEISLNCKKCSEAISVGRASVYRALDSLADSGLIKYENKKIYIKDLEGLERIEK